MAISAVFYFSTVKCIYGRWEHGKRERKSKSVENKLANDQSIKKMFFHLIGPP
jgi:hypothetical protein